MEYVAFVFGLFGLVAYLGQTSLKKRIEELERQLAKMDGTNYAEARKGLISAAASYIGQSVQIEMKEDHEDVDIQMYGNSKHGTNTILDVDDDWILVRVDSPKETVEKLIRLESVARIGLKG